MKKVIKLTMTILWIINIEYIHALQAIDVSRCDCVSSSGIISVINGHGDLEQLDAGYCLSVSLYLKFMVFCAP